MTLNRGGRKLRQVMENELEKGSREMAADLEAEAEALEWIEGTMGDVGDEPWNESFEDWLISNESEHNRLAHIAGDQHKA